MEYLKSFSCMLVAEGTTKALFQVTAVLVGCFLLGAKEQGPFIFEQEALAYKLKYEVEAVNENMPLDEIDCLKSVSVADCKLAKYKIENMQSYTSAFLSVMDVIRISFQIFGGLCLASIVLRPLLAEPTSCDE